MEASKAGHKTVIVYWQYVPKSRKKEVQLLSSATGSRLFRLPSGSATRLRTTLRSMGVRVVQVMDAKDMPRLDTFGR